LSFAIRAAQVDADSKLEYAVACIHVFAYRDWICLF
jgi:hypothetical protein